ncbi:MAG TPA: TlpA disulfide reductase family protein [Phnomibacter sp.]|nr:TlpA disulfide reductase family protein [Phnomibacter sp.]
MNRMKPCLLTAACMMFFFAGMAQPAVGDKAPEIKLKDTKGRVVALSSLQGKVVLIDFWASWCGPCRRSNSTLAPIYEKYKAEGFEIYGISVDEESSDWKEAIKEDNIKWMQVNDADNAVAAKWNLEVIPTSYLLDKSGKVVAVDPEGGELDELIQALLKKRNRQQAK